MSNAEKLLHGVLLPQNVAKEAKKFLIMDHGNVLEVNLKS